MNESDKSEINVLSQVSPQAAERSNNPRNYGRLEKWNGHARTTGPCGDTMEFWVQLEEKRIIRAGFTTTGCGPSRAAGSMATELAVNRPLREAGFIEQADILGALGGLPKDYEQLCPIRLQHAKGSNPGLPQPKHVPKPWYAQIGGLRTLLLDRLLVKTAATRRVRRAIP